MFQIGAANNSLFFWVLLSKTRHEKICQILLSNSQPTKNINLYPHLMTEFALQKRCQKIFSGAFFPTEPHAHPELCPISLKIKKANLKYLKDALCSVEAHLCVSAPAIYEWWRSDMVKHTMPVLPCLKGVISHFDYFISESNLKWHSNFTGLKKKEANQPLHNLILSTWRHFNNSKHEPFMK